MARRDVLRAAASFAAVAGLRSNQLASAFAGAPQDPNTPPVLGRRELVRGIDALSQVAADGNDPFADGHAAAAVISSTFFARENGLDDATQRAILALFEARFFPHALFVPRPRETAEPDPALAAGIVADLDAGIADLRAAGHNVIFAVAAVKALREVPETATPARVQGLRAMVRHFNAQRVRAIVLQQPDSFVDLGDQTKFVRFVFEEYLKALELWRQGRGHHGFAGHILTVGHALLELARMGHGTVARKGVAAFHQFVQQARDGADLGGRRVADAKGPEPTPLERDYWLARAARPAGGIVTSHWLKYPHAFYALLRELDDADLKRRVVEPIFHLTAVS
ncbi:MAG: hypothetical protein WBO45_23220 [Planctomycetota bacterium]